MWSHYHTNHHIPVPQFHFTTAPRTTHHHPTINEWMTVWMNATELHQAAFCQRVGAFFEKCFSRNLPFDKNVKREIETKKLQWLLFCVWCHRRRRRCKTSQTTNIFTLNQFHEDMQACKWSNDFRIKGVLGSIPVYRTSMVQRKCWFFANNNSSKPKFLAKVFFKNKKFREQNLECISISSN